jgi:hypothetical protein
MFFTDSAVPSGLGVFAKNPGVKTPGYCQMFLRNKNFGEIRLRIIATVTTAIDIFSLFACGFAGF